MGLSLTPTAFWWWAEHHMPVTCGGGHVHLQTNKKGFSYTMILTLQILWTWSTWAFLGLLVPVDTHLCLIPQTDMWNSRMSGECSSHTLSILSYLVNPIRSVTQPIRYLGARQAAWQVTPDARRLELPGKRSEASLIPNSCGLREQQ